MNFTWKYSLNTEIERLIFTANSIALGFYQKRGFLLFKNLLKNFDLSTSVIFPFREIDADIWKKLQKIEIDVGQKDIDEEISNEFSERFKDIKLIDTKQLQDLRKQWENLESKFNKTFAQTFPKIRCNRNVIIMPTQFGTIGSYFDNLKDTIFIYIRIDQDPSYIVELLVKGIIREYFYPCSEYSQFLMRKNLWNAYAEIADFILKTTGFSDLIPNHESLLRKLDEPEIEMKLIKKSNNYFKKLGFPVAKELVLEEERIRLSGKILRNLTITQHSLLVNFLKKEGEIVSFDEIAAIMWGENYYNRFSLTAMSKMIFQLRQKLKETGLQKEVIFTKRGQGYALI